MTPAGSCSRAGTLKPQLHAACGSTRHAPTNAKRPTASFGHAQEEALTLSGVTIPARAQSKTRMGADHSEIAESSARAKRIRACCRAGSDWRYAPGYDRAANCRSATMLFPAHASTESSINSLRPSFGVVSNAN